MIQGFCSNCRQEGDVSRFRMADVGLRWLDADCRGRLEAMGMHLVPVTGADPRVSNVGEFGRNRIGIGQRATDFGGVLA